MPELPEVETVRRGLAELVVGRRIADWTCLTDGTFEHGEEAQALRGRLIIAARRLGKVLILDLADGWSLVIHLKMTGQLVVRGLHDWGAGHPTDSLIGELPDRSSRVVFDLDDASRLFFNDQRRFGWIRLMPTNQISQLPLIAKLGPEPLDPAGLPEFRRRLSKRGGSMLKAALLDQSVVAGIGNIYADEAAWTARLHPAQRVASLSARAQRAVYEAAGAVMRLSIELGGSTDRNYVDAQGRRGAYLDFAKVFRRQGQPCPRCQRPIEKIRLVGRGTHLCPHCQRPPASR